MMTYAFPPSLYPLRDYMRGLGADTRAFVSARQAAFMAQQLLGTRVKFPDQRADMTPILLVIQRAVTEGGAVIRPNPFKKGKAVKGNRRLPKAKSNKHNKDFSPAVFAEGVHIFCDGASIPNPGVGGWGVVVYRDGEEIASYHGGNGETTNNQMEMMALLVAIEAAGRFARATIWCDSQYCVNGANDWRHKWKSNGWKKSPVASEHVKNVVLWKAIDEALEATPQSEGLSIRWVKGHAGIVGNERADELAEQGRGGVKSDGADTFQDDLDAQYRAIMAG